MIHRNIARLRSKTVDKLYNKCIICISVHRIAVQVLEKEHVMSLLRTTLLVAFTLGGGMCPANAVEKKAQVITHPPYGPTKQITNSKNQIFYRVYFPDGRVVAYSTLPNEKAFILKGVGHWTMDGPLVCITYDTPLWSAGPCGAP